MKSYSVALINYSLVNRVLAGLKSVKAKERRGTSIFGNFQDRPIKSCFN